MKLGETKLPPLVLTIVAVNELPLGCRIAVVLLTVIVVKVDVIGPPVIGLVAPAAVATTFPDAFLKIMLSTATELPPVV